jgi:hypothetical protein
MNPAPSESSEPFESSTCGPSICQCLCPPHIQGDHVEKRRKRKDAVRNNLRWYCERQRTVVDDSGGLSTGLFNALPSPYIPDDQLSAIYSFFNFLGSDGPLPTKHDRFYAFYDTTVSCADGTVLLRWSAFHAHCVPQYSLTAPSLLWSGHSISRPTVSLQKSRHGTWKCSQATFLCPLTRMFSHPSVTFISAVWGQFAAHLILYKISPSLYPFTFRSWYTGRWNLSS